MKIEKGPAEVLRGLTSGDPKLLQEALDFQNEAFKARFGCYPWELEDELGRRIGDLKSRDAVPVRLYTPADAARRRSRRHRYVILQSIAVVLGLALFVFVLVGCDDTKRRRPSTPPASPAPLVTFYHTS